MIQHTLTLKTGKRVTIRPSLGRAWASSINGHEYWEIVSAGSLSSEEVHEAIEREFPSPGYGSSRHQLVTKHDPELVVVEVVSRASCD